MKLRAISAILITMSACGGGGGKKAAAPTDAPPPAAAAGPEDHYKACGIYTTRDADEEFGAKSQDELTDADYAKMDNDPAMQTPANVDACMEFVRFVFTDLTDTWQLVAASDIAYGLCDGQAAVGEACYWKAVYAQLPAWLDAPEDADPSTSAGYLEQACEYGFTQACGILETGKDGAGRTWTLTEPEPAYD